MSVLSIPSALDAIVKASLILGITALAAASLRRASASARHLVWMLGLISALAVPAVSIVTPRWELPIVKITEATERTGQHHNGGTEERSTAGQSDSKDQGVSVSPLLRVKAVPLSPSSPSPQTPFSPSPAAVALVAWALGAAIVLGRMLLGLLAVQWMSRRTAAVTDAPWLDEARTLAASLGLTRVRFLRSGAQSMPMAWGVFRSSVLMPADADGWPIERLRIVLLHELAHVKRHDCLTHLVAQLACAAYWFNPLAWVAARRLRTERERACDDLVLASGTRGSDYADQLLDIARVMRAGRFPAVLAGATLAMAHRSQLEGRLMAILDPSIPRRGLTRVGVMAAVATFVLFIVPVAAVQPWTTSTATPTATPTASEPAAVKGPVDQNVVQADRDGKVQGAVQGGVQGGAQSGIAGGIAEGVTRGISEGVRGGVSSGVQGGVDGSVRTHLGAGIGAGIGAGVGAGVGTGVGIGVDVATGITQSVVNGMANGVANSVARNLAETAPAEGKQHRTADPRAVEALMEALKDTDKGVRETA
ncbi:MAG TPA: M56 family metallopeptidase, partial [Vicinamibacterales bacterium]|nr:M56 family metallopeptidase [Vicinamibacterales bacterium]